MCIMVNFRIVVSSLICKNKDNCWLWWKKFQMTLSIFEHLKHNQKSEIMIYFSTTFYFGNKKMKNPNAGNSLTWYPSYISGVALKSIPVMKRLIWPSSSSTEAGFSTESPLSMPRLQLSRSRSAAGCCIKRGKDILCFRHTRIEFLKNKECKCYPTTVLKDMQHNISSQCKNWTQIHLETKCL